MVIHHINFLGSFPYEHMCPKDLLPEYAFIGRSNVGKSSLINMILGRKDVARVSKQPGKTKTINLFDIDNQWRFADLPGYGYAKVSKTERKKWQKMIDSYMELRKQLVAVFLLLDMRIEPQKIDLEFAQKLGEAQIPFCLIFTKSDKVKKSQEAKKLAAFKKEFEKSWEQMPEYFISSAQSGRGREELLEYIEKINTLFNAELGKIDKKS